MYNQQHYSHIYLWRQLSNFSAI